MPSLTARGFVQTFVDETRPTNEVPDFHEAADSRSFETIVHHPEGGGPYPLIVYAHGISSDYGEHLLVLERLAEAGYVVATPNFPETSFGDDFRALENYVNQPADVTFITDALLALNTDLTSPVAGLIDPERIGLSGHSLGGATVYGAAFHSATRDSRVAAVVINAGVRFGFAGGDFVLDHPPLMLIHGEADETVALSESERTFAEATTPTWFVTVTAGGHAEWFEQGTFQDVVVSSTIAFFDLHLKRDRGAEARLAAHSNETSTVRRN
ncbi:MAG: alpha/beta fold hydrolase [Acidimicrobiia bacterium]|nr:alpha/beta fold hydrolase [Acidimicrobiia bacterium]